MALGLVVPMRHEFKRNVDVALLLKDVDYARTILDMAARSSNEQVRERAKYLDRMILGPRAAARAPEGPAAPATPAVSKDVDFDEQRTQAFKRYQGGLR